ncbi:polysaccharide deacetylase family protein [Paenibacillus sp. GCM10023248]|uniref:polysaccharide deacetylase family protein n=1 Tax=unclassified Paenibacillus TaxID=185978 RepID=UPI002377FC34|nr:polysaccharide deacetylase family protein [Paenibacillus sp. MAHUQ-63]MDD9271038.1 polysaccharide deacetylase family protein [Paenibacillus sp. MAHUQ-63]
MNITGKKVLSLAKSAGLFTLLLFLIASCTPASSYSKQGAVPAAASLHGGQAPDSAEEAAGASRLEEPVRIADMSSEPARTVEVGLAAPEQAPAAEPLPAAERTLGEQGAEHSEHTGSSPHTDLSQPAELSLSPGSPLPVDMKPEPPAAVTVTAATYVPKALKKVSIPVLNYHSVAIDPGNIVVISPDKLKEQMAYLHKQGYTPLKLDTFIRLLEGDDSLQVPEKPVLLTFDDGYIDNYEQAMPILAKYGFPATLFVSPGMTEQDGYLNWEQIRKLHEAGWDIQPHGMSHPHLPRLGADEQTYEIVEARKQIEAKLGTKADIFCYPYGEYNKTTLKILKQHGFRYAFTTEQGVATNQQPPYQLKRIFVNGEENLKAFAAKLPK